MGRKSQVGPSWQGQNLVLLMKFNIRHQQIGNNFEDASFSVRGRAKFVSPQAHPNIWQIQTCNHLHPDPTMSYLTLSVTPTPMGKCGQSEHLCHPLTATVCGTNISCPEFYKSVPTGFLLPPSTPLFDFLVSAPSKGADICEFLEIQVDRLNHLLNRLH